MQFKVPFDDHLKEQLGDYCPAVPNHIWENVKQKKDKKRPFFFFLHNPVFIVFSIITAGCLTGFFFFISNKNNTNFTASIKIISQHNKIAGPTENSEDAIVQNKIKTIKNTSNTEELNSSSYSDIITKEEWSSNRTNIQKTNFSNHDKTQIQKETDKDISSKKPTRSKTEQRISVSISQPSIDEENSFNEVNTDTKFSNEPLLKVSSPSVDLISLEHSSIPQLRIPSKINLNIPCPDDNKNPAANKKYIEVYAAADYVLRQFSDTPNSSYMRMRKESTSFASAYSAGLRFTKVFNNGFSIRAGLNFSQINEKFKFVEGNIIQVVFIINATGDTIGSYQTSNTRYKTSFNHYKTLDIPVTLGYEMSKDKWNINFNTGLIVNIHSWNQGEVLDETLQPVNISGLSHNPYQFKTNIGIGGIAAISGYYSLNNKLSILAEPYLRYNFSSMSKTELSLKQKYHTSGIKFGIRLNL